MYGKWFLLNFFDPIDFRIPLGVIAVLKDLSSKSFTISSAYCLDRITKKNGNSCPYLYGMYIFKMIEATFSEESEEGISAIVNGYIGKTSFLYKKEESEEFFNNSLPKLGISLKQAKYLEEYAIKWSQKVTIYITDKLWVE